MARIKGPAKNAVGSQIKAHQDIKTELAWPVDTVAYPACPEEKAIAEEFFKASTHERAKDSWSQYQILKLAQLCVVQASYEKIMREIAIEGPTTMGGKHGATVIANPKIAIASSYVAIINQQSPKLGLIPSNEEKRVQRSKAEPEQKARSFKKEIDDLIPGGSLLAI